MRDQYSLKQKFERFSNTNKRTVDPSCPLAVGPSKQISLAILGLLQVRNLSCMPDSDYDDALLSGDGSVKCSYPRAGGHIGRVLEGGRVQEACMRLIARAGGRVPGSLGVLTASARAQGDSDLLEYVTGIFEKFCMMADAVVRGPAADSQQVVRTEV